MAINEISVVLYQDHKRNTATAYLKFPKIKDEIYMGFSLDDENDSGYIKSRTSKSKLQRHLINGISSAICFYHDQRVHMSLYIGRETFYFFLYPTDEYPITHKGHWIKSQEFSEWLEDAE
jgi:hypothetical protein